METDIDRLAWDDELVSHPPVYENGHLVMPDRPGWGTEPNEAAIRARPPKGQPGLLNYGRKSEARAWSARLACSGPEVQLSATTTIVAPMKIM